VKEGIHPQYQPVIFVDPSCGFKVLTRSTITSKETMKWEDGQTYPVVHVEISSASHPFYTGKRLQIADRGGRVEQFRRRYGKTGESPKEDAGQVAEETTQA
jgi:large subunit ribosomal protein L31